MSAVILSPLDYLVNAINEKRPLVLLLGQDACNLQLNKNLLVEAALHRLRHYNQAEAKQGMKSLLSTKPLPDDFYDWLCDFCYRQVEPEWFEDIAALPLNAVFTSAVDPVLSKWLRVGGRNIELILSSKDNPISPRHRRNLHLTYLFGRAGENRSEESPPKTSLELLQRTSMHTNILLARLAETVTPLGVLLIDGLSFTADWLSMESLAGILAFFNQYQVFWFGQDVAACDERFMGLLAPEGPITFIPERLPDTIRTLRLENRIEELETSALVADGSVTIKGKVLEIESQVRFKTSTAATIIDDSYFLQPSPLGKEALYEEFRRFHGNSEDTRRLLEGIQRGFAVKRKFEDELEVCVKKVLADPNKRHRPVILHGQSGTGKSIALARLALTIRNENIYPVLFTGRSSHIPTAKELDDFCLRAEDIGADATLIVCDNNSSIAKYEELVRAFKSRKRRVVIVGSSYRLVDDNALRNRNVVVQAPAPLEKDEVTDLELLLKKYTNNSYRISDGEHILATIYRTLPDARPTVSIGLAAEAYASEDSIRLRGATLRNVSKQETGILGAALLQAGFEISDSILHAHIENFMGTLSDSASKIIDYVMLPGKLNCPVPINLLMRTVGAKEKLIDVMKLFSGIDLFRWEQNEDNDLFIQPRLCIEAELITKRRLGTPGAEVEIALQLLENAKLGDYGDCERRFVLDIVQKLGPEGPFPKRYESFYLNIARALTKLREKSGFVDSSLMLQESMLRRRSLRVDAEQQKSFPSNLDLAGNSPAEVLEEARNIIEKALGEFNCGRSGSPLKTCANLKVERAAIYGYRAVQQLQCNTQRDDVWQFYQAAKESARSAILSSDTYHAVDISLWVPNDLLKARDWPDELQAELIADLEDVLECVDSSQMNFNQQELYNERKYAAAQTLKNKKLEETTLKALEDMGSRAGIYLQAKKIGENLSGKGECPPEAIRKVDGVILFMEQYYLKLRDDARCLHYLLRAKWIAKTGTFLFGGERQPLPCDESAIQEILDILHFIENVEGSLGDPRLRYLTAVLQWCSGIENVARQIWNELSRETDYSDSRRLKRYHIWTDVNRKPRIFNGRIVREAGQKGNFRVQVEEINREIELRGYDFPLQELRRGADVSGGFLIAFNFIGPIAEPLRR